MSPDTSKPTRETVADYVRNHHGLDCPFCGADNISGSEVTIEAPHAFQTVECVECDREWTDIYDLARISVDGEVIEPADASDGLMIACKAVLAQFDPEKPSFSNYLPASVIEQVRAAIEKGQP